MSTNPNFDPNLDPLATPESIPDDFDPDFHDHPCIVMPATRRSRVKRRVRPLTPVDSDGWEPTANLNAAEPPKRYLHYLQAARDHFQPTDEYSALIAAHNARALWGLGRADEAIATSTNITMDVEWQNVDDTYEEVDPHCRSVLAAAKLAGRPLARHNLNEANHYLRRLSNTTKFLIAHGKAA
jgi:hypothetical protein